MLVMLSYLYAINMYLSNEYSCAYDVMEMMLVFGLSFDIFSVCGGGGGY